MLALTGNLDPFIRALQVQMTKDDCLRILAIAHMLLVP